MQKISVSLKPDKPAFRLRLLQTTDLHMHLLPFDYDAMAPSSQKGLANLVPTIMAYQADDIPTLLFDTGDFLQGNPLADVAIRTLEEAPHPIARSFNALHYDAVVLGNHDFEYGIDALRHVAQDINCPILSANVELHQPNSFFTPTTLIKTALSSEVSLNIGIIGLTTPVLSLLNECGHDQLTTTAPQDAARQMVTQLHDQGADLILALCHFGIDPDDPIENVVTQIAALDGIDVVMGGHTHETFPANTQHASAEIDPWTGTISGTPTVMAGAYGHHLGVIELGLSMQNNAFALTDANVSLITPRPDATPKTPAMFRSLKPLQDETVAHMTTAVAHTRIPFSTEFSLIKPDLTQFLLSQARQSYIETMLADRPEASLPILSSVAPFRAGSKSDPNDYISLPAGPVTRKDIAAIYPFNNWPVAVQRTGVQIKDWLEKAALIFRLVIRGETQQPLIDQQVPPYRFDTIFGLTYEIDVTAPAGRRIFNIRSNGNRVADTDKFVLVTSSHRINSGQDTPPEDIICMAPRSSQDILSEFLQRHSPVNAPCPQVWTFKSIPNTTAQFYTRPSADPAATPHRLKDNGITATGFRQFTLSFDE